MKIDLGCGTRKHPGFIGLDRIALPGVDVECDLNNGIPLEDHSVDFVMASRSLEYIEDLMGIMREIYRVCRHKAIVCILAPYAHTSYHLTNPYFRSYFDEHLPRYLTDEMYLYDPLQENQYFIEPLAGINREGNSEIDFRLLQCEFYYMPSYQSPIYEEEDKRVLRQSSLNVVDEILYYFVAVKEPITAEELEESAQRTYLEPVGLTERRAGEREPAESELHKPGLFRHDSGSVLPVREAEFTGSKPARMNRKGKKSRAAANKVNAKTRKKAARKA
ncbi:class I SAM-dependent methyltransferase [Paenibacillus lutrae]|uniref:Methyltransferase domain-containing protein n=1 Tax=Paenibacillus lutrae TaxID=2078573 RepID=A0A7X3JXJ8_9BACL|nr:methyltransferase domain-containing protein [Paenibacillus lutrae]MVO98118.1 methyltransferase domain-containing protein [Paenibacillus lutrae]